MIVVTGARGFIGSNMLKKLNQEGHTNLLIVDEFHKTAKEANLKNIKFEKQVDRANFIYWFQQNAKSISYVFHLGARTDTTTKDEALLDQLNLEYSKDIWKICSKHQIPLLYASSAATYGDGAHGYSDQKSIDPLVPLNLYGWSKQNFDLWIEEQTIIPPNWIGVKFFNVYGPNENHKGRMASVIWHAYHQIKENGVLKLFESHHKDYGNGAQLRDFIYVKDVVDICYYFMKREARNGIYNVGTGVARTFNDLGKAVFQAIGEKEHIEYIPIPEDIRDKYQYYTQATTDKLEKTGYPYPLTTLEDGISDYIRSLQLSN